MVLKRKERKSGKRLIIKDQFVYTRIEIHHGIMKVEAKTKERRQAKQESKKIIKKCKHSLEPLLESEDEDEELKDDEQGLKIEQRKIKDYIIITRH